MKKGNFRKKLFSIDSYLNKYIHTLMLTDLDKFSSNLVISFISAIDWINLFVKGVFMRSHLFGRFPPKHLVLEVYRRYCLLIPTYRVKNIYRYFKLT